MSEELDLFREDAEEQLQIMENSLVDAIENGVDSDKIGGIFRAMHTIKGTSGMFGFDGVVSFTHIAENLLDEVRNDRIEITSEMLSTFLEVRDHVEKLIEFAIEEKDLDSETEYKGEELLEILMQHLESSSSATTNEDLETIQKMQELLSEGKKVWHISLRFNENFFTSGKNILSIFSAFDKLGGILVSVPVINYIPRIEDITPINTYIGFELSYKSDVGYESIEEIFKDILDDIIISIFEHDDLVGLKRLLESQPEGDDSLEELLVHKHIFDVDIVLDALIKSEKKLLKAMAKKEEEKLNALNNPPIVEEKIETIEPPKEEVIEKKIEVVKEVKKVEAKVASPKPAKSEKKEPKKDKVKSFSLRVDSSKIDILINQMSEIVITNAKITDVASQLQHTKLSEASSMMNELLEHVRNGIMNMRMVQVEDSFTKFRRIVNDTAKKIGKDIDFVISGGDTELDKTVVEKISDPLVHMLRNSVDHGIEIPEVRVASGKSEKGRVDLRAFPDAGSIVIEIEDNGKGLDRDRLLQKGIDAGLIDPNAIPHDEDIYNLIFSAGLSTADKVSDISGRGVGMDVVKRNIEELRGTVSVESWPNKGSKLTIRIPLTLAIIDGFLVQIADTKYVIPLEMIEECIELDSNYKEQMKGNEYINLRGEILPIMDVAKYFGKASKETSETNNVIVVRSGTNMVGLRVGELFGEYQTVIKPLGDIFQNVPGISGGSILGSGKIALIFDIPKLVEHHLNKKAI
ncbi:MAG: chemotaxis protein CheA [Helicobacteraceae bacterium]|nr:chemotaxis protein CheA [Helicobacteraceae bacterium]